MDSLARKLGCGGVSERWSVGEGSRHVEGIKRPPIKLEVYHINAGDVNFPILFLNHYVPSIVPGSRWNALPLGTLTRRARTARQRLKPILE